MQLAQEITYTPFTPEFLIIPYQLFTDNRLTTTDSLVYGIIYWFEHLKDGRCTASNKTIGTYLHIQPRKARESISKLNKYGYINVLYQDVTKKERLEISTNVRLVHVDNSKRVGPHGPRGRSKTYTEVGPHGPQRKDLEKGIEKRIEEYPIQDLDKRQGMGDIRNVLKQKGIIK